MSQVYSLIGAAVGLAAWTALVAGATWRVARMVRDALARASAAEALVAARDLADEKATGAELRKIINGMREQIRELGYEGQRADEEAEARLDALDLASRDPARAVGLLLGANGADGDPPGGEGTAPAPPGPTA